MPSDPKAVTFAEAHRRLMMELDESWSDLRAAYARLEFADSKGQDYQDVRERFKATQESLWRLKEAWKDVS